MGFVTGPKKRGTCVEANAEAAGDEDDVDGHTKN